MHLSDVDACFPTGSDTPTSHAAAVEQLYETKEQEEQLEHKAKHTHTTERGEEHGDTINAATACAWERACAYASRCSVVNDVNLLSFLFLVPGAAVVVVVCAE